MVNFKHNAQVHVLHVIILDTLSHCPLLKGIAYDACFLFASIFLKAIDYGSFYTIEKSEKIPIHY